MVDDKQFIICRKKYTMQGWYSIFLSNGFFLSYEEKLKVSQNKNGDIVILGNAWQIDKNKLDPYKEIEYIQNEKELLKAEETWCGRYVIIFKNKIYLDATGLLGVYYSEGVVSSSINVLCKMKGVKWETPKLYHGVNPDFVPGAKIDDKGIFRLLISQIYDFAENRVYTRKILNLEKYSNMNDIERTNMFISYFINSLKNMKKMFPNHDVWIGLTGGRDSRVSLALLNAAEINIKAFTLEHDSITAGDVVVPKMLSKALNIPYYYIKRNKNAYARKKENDFVEHTAGMTVDQDKLFYSYGQYDKLKEYGEKNVLIIRSGIWECAVHYYADYIESHEVTFDNIYDIFPALGFNKLYSSSFHNWIEYVKNDYENNKLSLADRLYLEMRLGCWLSSIEQAFDCMDGIVSVQPMNSRVLIELILGYEEKIRISKIHEENITSQTCPLIKDIPYDTEINCSPNIEYILRRIIVKINTVKWLMKTYGLINTLTYYLN